MDAAEGTQTANPATRSRYLAPLLWSAVTCALLYGLGSYGAGQDAADQRVLAEIDGLVAKTVDLGGRLRRDAFSNSATWSAAIAIWCAVLAAIGFATAGRRMVGAAVGLAALATGAYAQALLFADQDSGWACLAVAFALAFASGLLIPSDATEQPTDAPSNRLGKPAEILLLLALLTIAVLARTWALPELRNTFDGESIHEMNMSRTAFGLKTYLEYAFTANASGLLQLPPQTLAFHLFGTSIFAQRFSAAIVGTFTLLLTYLFVRRIAGVWPAMLAAALLCLAPEQLFWSRNEVSQFAAVLLVAVLILHASFAMARDLGFLPTLATVLVMPLARLVYTPGWTMVGLPWALFAHAMVFGRVRRSKALYVLPLLALGTALWYASPSLLRWQFADPNARFVQATKVYGHSFVQRSGELRTHETRDLLVEQIRGISKSTALIAQHFFDDCKIMTHWYLRTHVSQRHRTIANAALAIVAFCGFCFLLARLRDRRAFALWVAAALAVLPTVMSPTPFPRRMEVIFLLLPIAAALYVAALVRATRLAGAPLVGHLLAASAAIGVVPIALGSAHSYFGMATGNHRLLAAHRFTRPIFAASDAIFHNLPYRAGGNWAQMIALGNLDNMLDQGTAFEGVPPGGWLSTALAPSATYSNAVHDVVFDDAHRAKLAAEHPLRHITFLFEDSPKKRQGLATVRALYPNARERRGAGLIALSIDRETSAPDMRPIVEYAAGRQPPADLRINGGEAVVRRGSGPATRIETGLAIGTDTWVSLRTVPPCPTAQWRIDGAPAGEAPQMAPMLSGIHHVDLSIPEECSIPGEIRQRLHGGGERPAQLVSPSLHRNPVLAPPPAASFAGLGEVRMLTKLPHLVVDLVGDGNDLLALGWDRQNAVVTRYDHDGKPLGSWTVGADYPNAIAVDDDGTVAVVTHHRLRLYDSSGKLLIDRPATELESQSTITFTADGLMLANSRPADVIVFKSRQGQTVRRLERLPGMVSRLRDPRSVAVGNDGSVVVSDESSHVYVAKVEGRDLTPIETSIPIHEARRGLAIDEAGRILVPAQRGIRVYRRDGTRLVARNPADDPANGKLGNFPVLVPAGDHFYALDAGRRALLVGSWKR